MKRKKRKRKILHTHKKRSGLVIKKISIIILFNWNVKYLLKYVTTRKKKRKKENRKIHTEKE